LKRLLFLLLPLLAAAFAAPAHAQRQGGYFGAGALHASTDNAREFALAFGGTSADKTADGLKVYGGYLWNQFGIEAGYYDLGTYDVRTGTVKSDEFKVSAFAVSGVLAMPMGSRFTLNAKAGVAFTSVDYRCFAACGGNFVDTGESNVAGLLGAGVAWRPAPNFSLRADFEYLGDVTHSVGLLEAQYPYRIFSLSAQLNF
jgi:hypothetical protein